MAYQKPETVEDIVAALRSGRLSAALDPGTAGIRLGLVDGLAKAVDKEVTKYHQVRNFLDLLAIQALPDWLFEQSKKGHKPDDFTPVQLYQAIHDRVFELQLAADANNNQVVRERKEHAAQIEKLQAELKASADQMAALKLLASYVPAAQPVPELLAASQEPAFFAEWKASKNYERSSALLKLLGDTGLARSTEIRARFAAMFSMDPSSASVSNAIQALFSLKFVESFDTERTNEKGRPTELFRLTNLGEAAYLMLTGKKTAANEWELKKYHKSDNHTLLNLAARDWLQKAGYAIVQDAPLLQMEDATFNPDIAASKPGEELIYIEVETHAVKGNQDTDAKWKRFARYSGGQMYIFCENSSAQNKVLREIEMALGAEKKNAVRVRFCNLARMTDDSFAKNGLWA